MEDLQQERARLDAEWEKLRVAKEEFQAELKGGVNAQDQNASGIEQKLFVGNLDDSTTEEEVRALFEQYGDIKEVFMLKDAQGKSKRSGFVKMFSKAAAERAIESVSGKIKDKEQEKSIVVRFAAPKSSFQPQQQQQANPYAQQQFAQFPSAGYGYGAAPAPYGGGAYGADQGYGAGANPYGAASRGMSGGGGFGSGRGPSGSNLYINNVAPTASEEEVRAMFSDFGAVLSIKLFASQGYGFVSFDNQQSASNAIHALNGLAIGNGTKRLEVSLKKDKNASRFTPY